MKNKKEGKQNGNKIGVAPPWPQRLFCPPYQVLSAILEVCAITPPNMAPSAEGSRQKKILVPRVEWRQKLPDTGRGVATGVCVGGGGVSHPSKFLKTGKIRAN